MWACIVCRWAKGSSYYSIVLVVKTSIWIALKRLKHFCERPIKVVHCKKKHWAWSGGYFFRKLKNWPKQVPTSYPLSPLEPLSWHQLWIPSTNLCSFFDTNYITFRNVEIFRIKKNLIIITVECYEIFKNTIHWNTNFKINELLWPWSLDMARCLHLRSRTGEINQEIIANQL